MKALHKLLAGTILVSLATFGLTALTSSSTNTVVPVVAFVNESCNSEMYMELESIQEMLELDGTELNGIVWDFESYNHSEDLQTIPDPECYLVSAIEKVVARGTPWPAYYLPFNPYGAQGGGRQPGTETTQFEFTNEELQALNDCWQKLAKKRLKAKKFKYEEVTKDYTWRSVENNAGVMGSTIHEPKDATRLPLTVTIFPTSIQSGRPHGTLSKHVARQVVLHEYIHTMQAERARRADPSWKDFKPYELYDNEVEAWNLSRSWYKQLYGVWAPLAGLTDYEINFTKTDTEFIDNKNDYVDYETKEANGTLTEEERVKMDKLEEWFRGNLPSFDGRGGNYKTTDKLEC